MLALHGCQSLKPAGITWLQMLLLAQYSKGPWDSWHRRMSISDANSLCSLCNVAVHALACQARVVCKLSNGKLTQPV